MALPSVCAPSRSGQLVGCESRPAGRGDGPQSSARALTLAASRFSLPTFSLAREDLGSLAAHPIWPVGGSSRRSRGGKKEKLVYWASGFLPLGSLGAPIGPTNHHPSPHCFPVVITAPSFCAVRSSVTRAPHTY